MRSPSSTRHCVYIDAGALFFAARDLYEDRQLEYSELAKILCRESQTGLCQPGFNHAPDMTHDNLWVMWTSFSPQNKGQARFLNYAEQELAWMVRRSAPSDSYLVDSQTTMAFCGDGKGRASNRLIRFDASIAYAIGRVAETHEVVVLTDSFTIAEPLIRSARCRTRNESRRVKNTLAFFGHALDSRWQGLLRGEALEWLTFIDLDKYEGCLFGSVPTKTSTMWEDGFPL